MSDRLAVVRDCYRAFETGERALIEQHLADGFTFYSPPDPGIDRDRYFERCWPNAGQIRAFAFERLVESGDEVFITYDATRADGSRFRNTEVFTFAGDEVARVEVYFGWDLG
jgi:ketosteroid isomerase-like protein